MREAVSDILEERAQLAGGMSRMVVVSLFFHALLIASVFVAPRFWSISVERETSPMMISLGGAPGPDSGGMNTISNRAVQREAAPEEKPTVTPPATKPPEMVAPEPAARPAPKTPAKPIEKPKDPSPTRKPSSGEKVAPGSGRVETPGAPQIPFGGGLTTGGGGTGGARVDVANFCCPSYLASIVGIIKRNWSERQGINGQNILKFVVRRDGTITNIQVEQSGGALLDIASERALRVTRRVPELPREYTGDSLTIHLIFEYTR